MCGAVRSAVRDSWGVFSRKDKCREKSRHGTHASCATSRSMVELAIPEDPVELDRVLEELPNRQAVFLLWPREGKPYLARTNVLRKRLKRLLGNLRGTSRTDRISVHRVATRSAVSGAGVGAEIPRGGLSQRHPAASAALREAHSFQSVSAYADHNSLSGGRGRCTSVRFAIDRRRRGSNRSFWTCFNCAGVRKIWSRVPTIRAASTARWGAA